MLNTMQLFYFDVKVTVSAYISVIASGVSVSDIHELHNSVLLKQVNILNDNNYPSILMDSASVDCSQFVVCSLPLSNFLFARAG